MKTPASVVDAVRELGPDRGALLKLGIIELSRLLGYSERRLYRIHSDLFPSGRAPRGDRLKHKIEVPQHVREFMFALTKQADHTADTVILATARHFDYPDDFVSVSAYNRWLREAGISRDDLKHDREAYRKHLWRSKANDLFLFDATVAKSFYANPDGSIGFEPAWANYKNKPGNRRPRLILWAGRDYFSGVIFARFCFRETTQTLLDFCFWAWSKKENPRFPACGIPAAVYGDEGAPQKSAIFHNSCDKLGSEIVRSDPSHWTEFGARRHGGVEREFGPGLLDEFMKWTKIISFKSLEEMNRALDGYLIRLNNRTSRDNDETRFAAWHRTVGMPRLMPTEEMQALLRYESDTRKVGLDMRIHLNGKIFELPNESKYAEWVGRNVVCRWYRGAEDKAIFVHEFEEIDLTALKRGGEAVFSHPYEAAAKTGRKEFLKKLDQVDLSTLNVGEIYNPDANTPYVPKVGTPFANDRISQKRVETATGSRPAFAPEKPLTRKMAIRELQRRDFFREPPSAGDFAWLDALLNDRIEIGETELLAAVQEAEEKMSAEASGELR